MLLVRHDIHGGKNNKSRVFLPLEEEIWAEQLAHSVSEERRERKDVEIEKAGYDIRTAVKKLEQMYE